MGAEMDTGVNLMKNTQWMRSFWSQANAAFRDPARMLKVRALAGCRVLRVDPLTCKP